MHRDEPGSTMTEVSRSRMDTALIIIGGFIFFALNVDFMMRGDAAMYADYALQARFDELTLHIGYYFLIFAADRTIGALLGLPIHETMVWLNVLAGALTLGVAYHLARELLGSRRDAIVCAIILGLCGRIVMNATTSEIYMFQTLFVLWSFLLFTRDRHAAAGAVAGIALLVSPLSAFAFLYFPVLDYARAGRIRWSVYARLAGACVVVYTPYLLFFHRELLWGQRGLLSVDSKTPFDPAATLSNFPRFQVKHYTVMLLLLFPAILAVKAQARLLAVTLAVAIPHIYVLLKLTSEDNVFILITDFFFVCWLVLGWRVLARSVAGKGVAALLVGAHAAVLIASGVLFHFRSNRTYAEEMRGIAREYIVGRDATMVSDWDGVMSLTHFGRASVSSTIERDPLWRQMVDVGKPQEMEPGALDADELYLLETWAPGPLRVLLSSDSAIADMQREMGIVPQAQRILGLHCTELKRYTHPLYRCTRRGPAPTPDTSGQRSPARE